MRCLNPSLPDNTDPTITDPRSLRTVIAPEETQLNRRNLVRGVTSGLVLAASGLFLPAGLVEAAENQVLGVQDRADKRRQRRQRRQRRIKQHRTKQRRQEPDRAHPPQLGPKGIRLHIYNENRLTPFSVAIYYGTLFWVLATGVRMFPKGDASSHYMYETEEFHVGVQFRELGDDGYQFKQYRNPCVYVENPVFGTPNTTWFRDGEMHFLTGYSGGTTVIDHQPLKEGESAYQGMPFTEIGDYQITVHRDEDVPGFKSFNLTVS